MQIKEFLVDLLFRHDLMNIIYKSNSGQYDEYEPEARHIEQQLLTGIPFKIAVIDVFSFFFHDGALINNSFKLALIEAEYYNYISKYSV